MLQEIQQSAARCNPAIAASVVRADGSHVAPGEAIATLEGPARGLLTAERGTLNFLCHMSGIATATAVVVACRPQVTAPESPGPATIYLRD